ncbi:MAG: translation initiation factor IF-3 [Candidatus Stahlbacteria bacterium]|nr:MAG: translation initiation factor IF-3 [Candidatus Stahlbacteria bacterium]
MTIKQLPRVNRDIRAQRVKLIDDKGQVRGEFHIREAMNMARESKLDLVEVAPNAKPPVCKLLDFGKYLYEKKRQERASRKHQHRTTGRGMRMSLKISEHDYQVKLTKVKEFLMDGDRVKVTLRLRGREMLHANLGMKVLEKLIVDLETLGKIENPPKREHNILHVTFLPEKKRR